MNESLDILFGDATEFYKPVIYEENIMVNFSGLEAIMENRFTIVQLYALITELSSLTNDKGCIENDLLISFFTRRLVK